MSLSKQTQWFYQGPPNPNRLCQNQAPFILHFAGAAFFFPPCVAVAEAVPVAQLLWEDAIRGCSSESPCSGWFSASFQHPEDLNQLSVVTGISLRIPTPFVT